MNKMLLGFLYLIFLFVFSGCDSKNQNLKVENSYITNFFTNSIWHTNTVVISHTNFYTNELIKTNFVALEIPQDWVEGADLINRIKSAPIIKSDEQALAFINSLAVELELNDTVKGIILEDDAKAKFELTLRNNGVKIKPSSPCVLNLSVRGFYDHAGSTLCYSVILSVTESHVIFRHGHASRMIVTVWSKGSSFGTVGRNNANTSLMNDVEKCAEVFANDYLSANSSDIKNQQAKDLAKREVDYYERQLMRVQAGWTWNDFTGWDQYGIPIWGEQRQPGEKAINELNSVIESARQSAIELEKKTAEPN